MDRRSGEDYQAWLLDILNRSSRVLKRGGTLFLYHLPVWAMRLGAKIDGDLEFRHWIAISMKNGFVRGDRLYPAHYALLMFTKGPPAQFTRPKLDPAKCRHCKGLIKDYGGYRKIIEKKGINLSDFWDDLSPVRHANRKHRKANELPLALFDRVLAIAGQKGARYVDPFCGTGSGVIAAIRAGMTFAACDILRSNCRIVCKRVDGLKYDLQKGQRNGQR